MRLLKQPLAGAISTDGDRLSATVACDAPELLEKLRSRRFSDLRSDYPGPFLEGLGLTLGEELEEWVFETREYLAGRVRAECIELGREAAASADGASAARWAEAAMKLAGAPELEAADLPTFYSLLRLGNSPLSQAVREEARLLDVPLDDALGPASTVSLPGHDAKGQLPVPSTSFVGRDRERSDMLELLAQSDCRLLTVCGGGGVGKTRLATEVGRQLAASGQAVFFASLEATASADGVLAKVAESVGVTLGSQADLLDRLASFSRSCAPVLILDNFEHLMAGAAAITALLRRCGELKLVVTSRERLNLPDEWVVALEGLPVDEEVRPGSSALTLFAARARSAQRSFALDAETARQAGKVCQLVGGYPLAIELAASWTRVLPVEEILSELERGWAVLTASSGRSERHASMQATFEYSYKLLEPGEQTIFRRLALFSDPFTRQAASAVSGANLFQLARLIDKSLVTGTARGRYALHPLLRRFALQKLREANEAEATFELYAAHYEEVLRAWAHGDRSPKHLEPEIRDILRVLSWRHGRGEDRAVVDAMVTLTESGSYYAARGHTADSARLLSDAAEAARSAGWSGEAGQLFTKLGNHHLDFGRSYAAAEEAYSSALACARREGNGYREAVLLSLLGVVRFHQEKPGADGLLGESYRLARERGDGLALAHVRQQQGYIAGARGSWPEARRSFVESVKASEAFLERHEHEHEAAFNLFFALCNQGEAEKELGDLDASAGTRARALQLAEARDNELWAAHADKDLGEVLHLLRDSRAAFHFSRVFERYERQGLFADAEEVRGLLRNSEKTFRST